MLLLYKFVSKFLQMVLNLMFVMQILLFILVFLTAAYWFCDLLTLEMFNFAEPIAAAVSNFVRLFYQGNIEVGEIYVYGSLLLFDILSLLFVFIITKAKYYVYNSMSFVDSAIYECNRKIEEQFNEQLEKELEADMKAINNTAPPIDNKKILLLLFSIITVCISNEIKHPASNKRDSLKNPTLIHPHHSHIRIRIVKKS